MKELIREILKENLSDINTDKGELKRKIGFKTIGQNTLKVIYITEMSGIMITMMINNIFQNL